MEDRLKYNQGQIVMLTGDVEYVYDMGIIENVV